MKKVFFAIILLMAICQRLDAQSKTALPNLGLISQLVEIKYLTEEYLSIAMDDSNKETQKEAVMNYNLIRIELDRLLFQLSADMIGSNSIKRYKKLNSYYKSHLISEDASNEKLIAQYSQALQRLQSDYKEKIHPTGNKTAADITAIVQAAWQIIKDLQDLKTQKVTALIQIFDELRLTSPDDIGASKDANPSKKDSKKK